MGKHSRQAGVKCWLGFWNDLGNRKKIVDSVPPDTEEVIRWLHGELLVSDVFRLEGAPKFHGNKNPLNDRLAIGLRPRKPGARVSRVAFSLFPMPAPRYGLEKGELLFLLHAVDAQKKKSLKNDEGALARWLAGNGMSQVFARCIYPNSATVGEEGDLSMTGPYFRYVKMAIRGFDGKKFLFTDKQPGGKANPAGTVRVSAEDVWKFLLFQIEHRKEIRSGRTS
jgi:hypothetical protein